MKKLSLLLIFAFVFAGQNFAQVKKKTKSEAYFKSFGKYKSEENSKITKSVKLTDSKIDFKGEGIAGKLVGKFIKKGKRGQIANLEEMMQYDMDHKKKEYTVKAIEKITFPTYGEKTERPKEEATMKEERTRVVRSIFRVDKTGDKKDVNKFPCDEYTLLFLMETEDIASGIRRIDSLFVIIWTTEFTDELKQAHDEEMNFTKAHMAAIGLDFSPMQADILGSNWISMLGKFKKEEKESKPVNPKLVQEMEKLEGYPVVIDGKHFTITIGDEKEEKEEETDGTDVKKSVGRFAKGLFNKKEEPKGPQPDFTYYTELIEFSPAKFNDEELRVNKGYKLK